MITFYPGPSKLYPQVAQYLQDACACGVLSINHRSAGFMDILQETLRLMHLKLHIPDDYTIYFTSSATECWEVVAQSLTSRHSAHHYNGAFGKKWFSYTSHIVPQTSGSLFQVEHTLPFDLFELENDQRRADFNAQRLSEAEVLCLTQNETSNGTQINNADLAVLRNKTSGIVAIDVTSSLGGVALDWAAGDVWLASSQKCLGLPAGLGILVCSPRALQHATQVADVLRYNSLLFMHENFSKYQTHYTPNALVIYLLMRLLQQLENIETIAIRTQKRAQDWYNFLENHPHWQPLVQNPAVRSDTVIAVKGAPDAIAQLKKSAVQAGITLGNGYGEWRNNTFRIANFPAISHEEITTLQDFLRV
ncbi:MAG: aminotransferase class V-fold PLP-dependent enzyme [Runella slithyformis]|nr:MAG: aminotransferase class V-fold PLP-dependent enzyme [Runella slithyformis]